MAQPACTQENANYVLHDEGGNETGVYLIPKIYIMLFKGTYILFLNYLLFGITHGGPSREDSLGIMVASRGLQLLCQGPVRGDRSEATRTCWEVHVI